MARITPRSGDLVETRPIELIGLTPEFTATINPPEADLLLSGPLPTLQEIEKDSNLIQVWADVSGVTPGQSTDLPLSFFTPEGVQVQLRPPSVQVTVTEISTPFALNTPPSTTPKP